MTSLHEFTPAKGITMSIETKVRTKRFVQLAITTALASATLSGCTGKAAPSHAYSAQKAETALMKGRTSKAVEHAEAAVLANPRDAATRTLLGNAYLEDGRFLSAEMTFAEAIELGDTAPRTVISHALSQIALGDHLRAQDTLLRHQSDLDPADFGLAIALSGRPDQGVEVLSNALRAGQNTAKVRQNLAYAYAMQGNWRAARIMASEDVPAGQVGDRMAEWAALARPEAFTMRVAKLLNVEPQADAGQPAMLALANHPSIDMLAAEEVAPDYVADAAPAAGYAFAEELPPVDAQTSYADAGDAALADAGLAPVAAPVSAPAVRPDPTPRFASNEVVQSLAIPAPRSVAPRAASEAAKAARVVTTRRVAETPASGDYNVQLGSFNSMSSAHEAWKQFQKRYPEMGDAERVITKAKVNGKIYYRVAAIGFAKASAQSLCRSVKGKGGGCMAYAASTALPGTIDIVAGPVRVAAR